MIVNYPLLVFALSVVILSLAVELGEVLRRRIRSSKEEERDDFGVVLGANLTLLELLIGFSFSMAVSAGLAETLCAVISPWHTVHWTSFAPCGLPFHWAYVTFRLESSDGGRSGSTCLEWR